eukprot:920763-Amorphochlora_amoeboformis.AAC.1
MKASQEILQPAPITSNLSDSRRIPSKSRKISSKTPIRDALRMSPDLTLSLEEKMVNKTKKAWVPHEVVRVTNEEEGKAPRSTRVQDAVKPAGRSIDKVTKKLDFTQPQHQPFSVSSQAQSLPDSQPESQLKHNDIAAKHLANVSVEIEESDEMDEIEEIEEIEDMHPSADSNLLLLSKRHNNSN